MKGKTEDLAESGEHRLEKYMIFSSSVNCQAVGGERGECGTNTYRNKLQKGDIL